MKRVPRLNGDLSEFVTITKEEKECVKAIENAVLAQVEAIPIMPENIRTTVKEWLEDVFDLREEGCGMFIVE